MSTHPAPVQLPLSPRLVEEGKEHPFVQVVVNQLKIIHQDAVNKTVGYGWNGGSDWQMRTHAARAVAIAEALRLIQNSVGTEDQDGD